MLRYNSGELRLPEIARFGPAIGQLSYEVGDEFYRRFLSESADNARYFIPSLRDRHYLFDLKAYAGNRLAKAGVGLINILANDTCSEENEFFSWRRTCLQGEKAYGRQLSVIALQP